MQTKDLRLFYFSLPSIKAKDAFKAEFFNKTKLAYPTFYSYLNNAVRKIPFVYAEILKEIAIEQKPELYKSLFPEKIK